VQGFQRVERRVERFGIERAETLVQEQGSAGRLRVRMQLGGAGPTIRNQSLTNGLGLYPVLGKATAPLRVDSEARGLLRIEEGRKDTSCGRHLPKVFASGLAGAQFQSIVVAIDTSGSMPASLLSRLGLETRELATNNAELTPGGHPNSPTCGRVKIPHLKGA
jgi:hypothetical protein